MPASRLTDAEILAQIPAARRAGRRAQRLEPTATAARYDETSGRMIVSLNNGTEIAFPASLGQGLAGATPMQLAAVQITPPGDGLHWEELDVDLLVSEIAIGIFGSAAWMREHARQAGRARSMKKAAASRANGAKGGRPKRLHPAA